MERRLGGKELPVGYTDLRGKKGVALRLITGLAHAEGPGNRSASGLRVTPFLYFCTTSYAKKYSCENSTGFTGHRPGRLCIVQMWG